MRLYSTQDPHTTATFAEAVELGLAPDGGLFMPAELPALEKSFFPSAASLSFQDLSFEVARLLLHDEIPEKELRVVIDRALDFPAPLHQLEEGTSALELFHGPTLAFKDFGARFMAHVLAYLDRGRSRERVVLVATSGDTGSAVAHGFSGVPSLKVVLLYPSGKVSATQELQLTTAGGNVSALEVEGT